MSKKLTNKEAKIGVVVPAYNDRDNVMEFLASIDQIHDDNLLLVIVDDGSIDGTAAAVEEAYPGVKVLKGDGNLWWSGATNLGAKHAIREGCDYIYTINNDVILDPHIFDALREAAQQLPKTIISSKIYDEADRNNVWYFGAFFDQKKKDILLVSGKDKGFDKRTEIEVATGMGMLIPVETFNKIGYFDQAALPQYLADSDFGLRAKYAGYINWVEPKARVYSKVGSSWVNKQLANPRLRFLFDCLFARRSPYAVRIRAIFYRRHWPTNYVWALMVFYTKFIYSFMIRGFLPNWIKAKLRQLRGIIKT